MNKGFSCYLDLIRVAAAALVFLHHLALGSGCYTAPGNGCATLATLVPFHAGHSAVVVFFVLSGYVITYVATERETTLRDFSLSRLARVYSVAIPTLALIVCIDALSYLMGDHAAYPKYQYDNWWKYLPLILTFSTDHWFLAENAFSLGAWWSIAYEFWYYVLFAAFFYLGGWWRWVAPLGVMLVIGPKLLALFPLWLLGSLVYRLHRTARISRVSGAAIVFALTIVGIIAVLLSNATLPIDRWADSESAGWITQRLRFSQWFAGDFLLAGVFALNIWVAKYIPLRFGRATSLIRRCAGYTFTFYMIHGPVLKVFAKYVDEGMVPATLATIAFTFAFGIITERQKDRLRGWLSQTLVVSGSWIAKGWPLVSRAQR